jgi:cytochrome d ubiquinol oxidase subunit II
MEKLQLTWFFLWALLWIVYFALDGFVLGCGLIMNFISKNENEKRAVISSIGPFWEANEVWLITAGGATFAAFPSAYADMFSFFYLPLFFILLGLIVRGVSFELRSKFTNKKIWDISIFIGSILPSLLFGIMFGNFWAALNITANGYEGGIIGLFSLSGFITAFLFLSFFIMNSMLWLLYRFEGEMVKRIYSKLIHFWRLSFIAFGLFLLFLPFRKNPNFNQNSLNGYMMIFFYVLAFLSFVFIRNTLKKGKISLSFISSLLAIVFFLAGSFCASYPNIIASINKGFNISIFNCSSSYYTLKIMTIVAIIFVPLVISYQLWIYSLLNYKINPEKEETLSY